MKRLVTIAAWAIVILTAVTFAEAAQRGRTGGRNERGGSSGREAQEKDRNESSRNTQAGREGANKAPGGEWSERTHSGGSANSQFGKENGRSPAGAAAAGNAAGKNKAGQPSAAQGAAADAAVNNRRSPQATGAQGAAAGAAAANRNNPNLSGAQGAAAGAAASNRNNPNLSGAQGAAAGAAAANRNNPNLSGAQGAAVGAAAANRNSPQFSGAQGAAAGAAVADRNSPAFAGADGYAAVRSAAYYPNMYGAGWYGSNPGAWTATGWAAGAAWAPTPWNSLAGTYGYGNNVPLSYNYGNNVNYQNGNVMVAGQSVGTAEQYSQQAYDIADMGFQADVAGTEKWMPLGVFAMVRNENQHPQLILQLAINEQGILRGNYTDEVTENTSPIHGAVDKQTQRAAWTVGDNKTTVMEAGLKNLTDPEAPALIHKNGKTDHWLLVRLENPAAGNADSSPGGR